MLRISATSIRIIQMRKRLGRPVTAPHFRIFSIKKQNAAPALVLDMDLERILVSHGAVERILRIIEFENLGDDTVDIYPPAAQ